ncbi:MAG: HAD-IA family hydrolase [Lachnospiraceae bacterium]|nr:HAD-IA family hydrolase [Lachnospiraceae bacterium]
MTEQEYVIQQFNTAFKLDETLNTVIYGLGKNTEAVLSSLKQTPSKCGIIGLMDSKNTGKIFFDLPVLSDEEVIARNARIIIIARESVVPVIFERIEYLSSEHKLEIYDFKGIKLEKMQAFKPVDCPYWHSNEAELRKEIDRHDVISFDIFDTLIMRRVLEPSDIFEIVASQSAVIKDTVEQKLASVEKLECFVEERIKADNGGITSIEEIYDKLSVVYKLSPVQKLLLMQRELETELKYSVPRRKMHEIFNYALSKHKKVYLVSDMYLSSSQIKTLLDKCGYSGYEELIVSSEYKVTKESGGLFEVLKGKCDSNAKILHIGDNRRADGERAKAAEIDSYIIGSAYELWMASSMKGTLSKIGDINQRLMLAQLIYEFCEDPFSLVDSQGLIKTECPEKLGYMLGPVFSELVKWLRVMLKKNNITQLLLPSRDGYLIKRLLDCYKDFEKADEFTKTYSAEAYSVKAGKTDYSLSEKANEIKYTYFKSSRRAVSIAALKTKEDALQLASRKFEGNIKELLYNRFGIDAEAEIKNSSQKTCSNYELDVDELENFSLKISGNHKLNLKDLILSDYNKQNLDDVISAFLPQILAESEEERKEYLKYLENVGLLNGEGAAIFDFVAGGTVQYYLQKLLGKELLGVYVATMNHPNPDYNLDGKIVSAYGNILSYGSDSKVGKYYLFLEPIMTDGFGTLVRIKNGKMEYEAEDSFESAFDIINRIQDGIVKFTRDNLEYGIQTSFGEKTESETMLVDSLKLELEFADSLFGRMMEGSVDISEKIRRNLINDDLLDGIKPYKVSF